MSTSFVYLNPRPQLAIVSTGGRSLGRCYTENTFRVTSTRPLTLEQLYALNKAGLLGFGQEFGVTTPESTMDKSAGSDLVPCSCIDDRTGEQLPGPAINPYSGLPYAPTRSHYYVYDCYTRCDSGD